jgi:hypothetical protein
MSYIKLNRAIDLLRKPDTRLIKQNHNGRHPVFYCAPGRRCKRGNRAEDQRTSVGLWRQGRSVSGS